MVRGLLATVLFHSPSGGAKHHISALGSCGNACGTGASPHVGTAFVDTDPIIA